MDGGGDGDTGVVRNERLEAARLANGVVARCVLCGCGVRGGGGLGVVGMGSKLPRLANKEDANANDNLGVCTTGS